MRNILAACLLSLAALSAYSADGTSVKEGGAAQMFVTKATEEGLTQVELGKLAQSRSSNPDVKAFAAKMIADHTKANAELATIAKRKGLDVPTQLDGEHATVVHAVGTKPPSEFDAEYAKHMVEGHEAAITLFSDASAIGDKDIAAFAKRTLATVHNHHELAVALPAKRPPEAGRNPASAAPANVPAQ